MNASQLKWLLFVVLATLMMAFARPYIPVVLLSIVLWLIIRGSTKSRRREN